MTCKTCMYMRVLAVNLINIYSETTSVSFCSLFLIQTSTMFDEKPCKSGLLVFLSDLRWGGEGGKERKLGWDANFATLHILLIEKSAKERVETGINWNRIGKFSLGPCSSSLRENNIYLIEKLPS